MRRIQLRFFFFIVGILLFISGCARIFHKSTLSLDSVTIGEIRHRVEQNYLKFHSAKAKAKISLESPQISFTANSAINIKMPDSLLIKLSAGLGFGVGAIFMDGNQFLIYNSLENFVYIANPDSVDLKRFLFIDINLEELIQAFSGLHLIQPHTKESLKIDNNQYLLVGSENNYLMKYRIDPKRFVVNSYELSDSLGHVIVKFEYSRFAKIKGVTVPKTIRISQPEQKTRMTIVFTTLTINSKLKPKDFEIKLPDNVDRILL